jgi:hypothetical protein
MTSWRQRISWWLHRRHREDTLRVELEFHLADESRERRDVD